VRDSIRVEAELSDLAASARIVGGVRGVLKKELR
jgi:hypothetical protein